MRIQKLAEDGLRILTALFDYDDVDRMAAACAREIRDRRLDIYVLSEQDVLIGELHVLYEHEDGNYAVRGRRAYLHAFRIRDAYQNKGYGKRLLGAVIADLKEHGYTEFTVGVEDGNERALHIYRSMGFDHFLLRTREEYQGDAYEYNLYLKNDGLAEKR